MLASKGTFFVLLFLPLISLFSNSPAYYPRLSFTSTPFFTSLPDSLLDSRCISTLHHSSRRTLNNYSNRIPALIPTLCSQPSAALWAFPVAWQNHCLVSVEVLFHNCLFSRHGQLHTGGSRPKAAASRPTSRIWIARTSVF